MTAQLLSPTAPLIVQTFERITTPSSDENDDLNTMMIKNLTAMTATQLKKDVREERKKSMISTLPTAWKVSSSRFTHA
jgi:hypothetical protein